MITVRMRKADPYEREHYGRLWESEGTLTVRGFQVHNPEHDHRVYVVEEDRGYDAPVYLSAKPTVISAYPGEPVERLGEVLVGEELELKYPDGHDEVYRVRARWLADPVLDPVTD